MRWLLITTNPTHVGFPGHRTWNIGDVFARLGTELAVREVDPSAEFSHLNVDNPDDYFREQEFDFCLFAGRPLFWPGCRENHVHTHILDSWPAARKDRIAAFGVGVQYPFNTPAGMIGNDISAVAEKVHSIMLRTHVPGRHPVVEGCCPAAFLAKQSDRELLLCNFMPSGGHCPEWAEEEAGVSTHLQVQMSPILLDLGYLFVAHVPAEARLAEELGWPSSRILYSADDVWQYVRWYASASAYVGNRVHGAILAAANGANVSCIGYDTRNRAVEQIGGMSFLPSELDCANLEEIVRQSSADLTSYQIARVRQRVDLFRDRADEFLRTLVGT